MPRRQNARQAWGQAPLCARDQAERLDLDGLEYNNLGQPKGSEPALVCPVVVVQDDLLTQSRLATTMVVPLTTNLKRAIAAGNVELAPADSGLEHSSVALVCQVMTVDKSSLFEVVAVLPKRALRRIDAGLRLALGLEVGV